MLHRRLALSLGALVLALSPGSAGAQGGTDPGLSSILLNFFNPDRPTIVLLGPPPGSPFPSHAAHFSTQSEVQQTMRQLNAAIVSQLATFPLGSSSGSFTYTYDPTLGVFTRSTDTFGPSFAERAQTAGRGKLSVGLNYLSSRYSSLDNVQLDDGSITLFLAHEDTNNDGTLLNPFFEGDIIETRLFFELESNTVALYANYGLSDRLDVGVAVPYTSIDVAARIDARIEPLASGAAPIHRFADGSLKRSFSESGSASGIGDVILRGKYRFGGQEGLRFALAADVRLPSGNEEDLLGTGAFQLKPYLIASGSLGRVYPHLNLGYTFSLGESDNIGEIPDEFNYTVGFDTPLHPRVSIALDVLGRYLVDTNRLVKVERPFRYAPGPAPAGQQPAIVEVTRIEYALEQDSVNLLLGAFGVKYNLFGNFVLSGNVFVPLNNNGLRSDLTVTIGGDFSF
jgi:hypothetical protein